MPPLTYTISDDLTASIERDGGEFLPQIIIRSESLDDFDYFGLEPEGFTKVISDSLSSRTDLSCYHEDPDYIAWENAWQQHFVEREEEKKRLTQTVQDFICEVKGSGSTDHNPHMKIIAASSAEEALEYYHIHMQLTHSHLAGATLKVVTGNKTQVERKLDLPQSN